MRVKEESEKAGLKFNIQKTKIAASGPITLWQIEGKKVEAVTDFIFLSSKITEDSDCSHEIKTLSTWKEIYDQSRQCIKKQRHHIADRGSYRQSYGYSSSHIQMQEWDHKEGWVPKNYGAFELWCWRRFLRLP